MPFKLVHQVYPDIARTSAVAPDVNDVYAHGVDIYDYLFDYFWPSLGYQVGDDVTDTPGLLNPLKFRTVNYPVTNAAGYADHMMQSVTGVSGSTATNAGIFTLFQHRNTSTTNTVTINSGGYSYSYVGTNNTQGYKEVYSWLHVPANIFQDTERPSDWFVTIFGRIVLWYVKPRVVIYDEFKPSIRLPDNRYDTWVGFSHNISTRTLGGLNTQGSGGGTPGINALLPQTGWATDEAALYEDFVLTHGLQSTTYPQKFASIHNPNCRIFTPPYKTPVSNAAGTVLNVPLSNNGLLWQRQPYVRMQDNQGNWWIRTTQYGYVNERSIAFNCGTELPP